jgi:NAD-dependent deacetylase
VRLELDRYKKIVALTGAGVSVASGLPTYRGPGGLWTQPGNEAKASARALEEDLASVWRFFGPLRADVARAEPNAAHLALADAEARLGDRFTLITQNVDGLHRRAGSARLIELHGALGRARCTRCDAPAWDDDDASGEIPACPACGAPARPDVVLFDEAIPARADHDAKRAFRDCDLFLAVGTSGTVDPAARFVSWARYEGARTVLVNLEESAAFDDVHIGRAEALLPELLAGS